MDDSFRQARELTDLIEIGDAILPKHFDAMIVFDVEIDGFVAVFGFKGDFRRQVAFEIEGDDFAFMGDGTGEVMDIAAGRQQVTFFLDLVDIFADDGIADAKKNGQIEL